MDDVLEKVRILKGKMRDKIENLEQERDAALAKISEITVQHEETKSELSKMQERMSSLNLELDLLGDTFYAMRDES